MKPWWEEMDEHALWMDEHKDAWVAEQPEPEVPYRNSRTYVYYCKGTTMDAIKDAYEEYRRELAYC